MRRPRRRSRTDLRRLTPEQTDELSHGWRALCEGFSSVFDSEEEAAEAWRLHGARITERWDTPFRRPRGWWLYGQGEEEPSGPGQLIRLVELDELTAEEVDMLPHHVSAWQLRALVERVDLKQLSPGLRRALVEHPSLLAGLTPQGVADFIHGLPGTIYAWILRAHGVDYDSLPKPEAA